MKTSNSTLDHLLMMIILIIRFGSIQSKTQRCSKMANLNREEFWSSPKVLFQQYWDCLLKKTESQGPNFQIIRQPNLKQFEYAFDRGTPKHRVSQNFKMDKKTNQFESIAKWKNEQTGQNIYNIILWNLNQ
ncbi:low-density lipoprotein receptor-related protein 6 [Sarcoptes scabiei]|nr:low-density lipoprotein receptor-related protein 6 [Sarcoptes scabiei]